MTQPAPAASAAPAPQKSFAALRHPAFRIFFATYALSMMADNVEHVISYWIMWRKFQSPFLGGVAVVTHWLPFLFFAVYSGALADRFDPRKLTQIAMLIFMGVSVAWGVLFLTDTAEPWHAVVLLSLHGVAGVLWQPASQLMLHDIVSGPALPSAVRLNAMARYLGFLAGPAVGAGLMLWAGPAYGLFINALIYVPLLLWMMFGKFPPKAARPPRPSGWAATVQTVHAVRDNRTIWLMVALAGAASMFVGGGYHAQLPGFAHRLGHGQADFTYSMLLAADAAGALTAGLLLEGRNLMAPRPRLALGLAAIWSILLAAFALNTSFAVAIILLFFVGFLELTFSAMAQALVQLNAPEQIRGRIIGLFNMSALGLRTFAGVTVGFFGSVVGIQWSLAVSAFIVLAICLALLALPGRR